MCEKERFRDCERKGEGGRGKGGVIVKVIKREREERMSVLKEKRGRRRKKREGERF